MSRYRNVRKNTYFNAALGPYAGYLPAGMQGAYSMGRKYVKKRAIRQVEKAFDNAVFVKKKRKIKSNKKLSKDVNVCKKAIKTLKLQTKASLGKLTYRRTRADTIRSATNSQAVKGYAVNRTVEYQNVLTFLKYYDPSNPSVLINTNGNSGTFQKDFLFKSVYSKLELRNSYMTDAMVTVYLCLPKADTDQSPENAWTDGIANDAGNVASNTAYSSLPNDYDTFRDFYNTKRVLHQVIKPGQTISCSNSIKDVTFDPAYVDTHSLLYQKVLKSMQWLVIVKGLVAHDNASSVQQGVIEAGVDSLQTETFECHYDAGVDLSYIHIENTLDTPTNGFVQGQQQIPDNITYEIN